MRQAAAKATYRAVPHAFWGGGWEKCLTLHDRGVGKPPPPPPTPTPTPAPPHSLQAYPRLPPRNALPY